MDANTKYLVYVENGVPIKYVSSAMNTTEVLSGVCYEVDFSPSDVAVNHLKVEEVNGSISVVIKTTDDTEREAHAHEDHNKFDYRKTDIYFNDLGLIDQQKTVMLGVRAASKEIMGGTDWAVIRKMERGIEIPKLFVDHRSAILEWVDAMRKEVWGSSSFAELSLIPFVPPVIEEVLPQ